MPATRLGRGRPCHTRSALHATGPRTDLHLDPVACDRPRPAVLEQADGADGLSLQGDKDRHQDVGRAGAASRSGPA